MTIHMITDIHMRKPTMTPIARMRPLTQMLRLSTRGGVAFVKKTTLTLVTPPSLDKPLCKQRKIFSKLDHPP